ncbi:MAG: hypothetical protein K8R88_09140 [Armatimonadetes bacterium]|nr:hypothetical protein [Armatimonadota bacterium]
MHFVPDLLVHLGLAWVEAPFKPKPNPILIGLWYCFFGVVAGGLSLLAFPNLMIQTEAGQIASVVLSPFAASFLMVSAAAIIKRDDNYFRFDRFANGYALALCLALVRFYWGR